MHRILIYILSYIFLRIPVKEVGAILYTRKLRFTVIQWLAKSYNLNVMLLLLPQICILGLEEPFFFFYVCVGSTSIAWKNVLCAKDTVETAGIYFKCIQQVLFIFFQFRKRGPQIKERQVVGGADLQRSFPLQASCQSGYPLLTCHLGWVPPGGQVQMLARGQNIPLELLYLLVYLLPVFFVFCPDVILIP